MSVACKCGTDNHTVIVTVAAADVPAEPESLKQKEILVNALNQLQQAHQHLQLGQAKIDAINLERRAKADKWAAEILLSKPDFS